MSDVFGMHFSVSRQTRQRFRHLAADYDVKLSDLLGMALDSLEIQKKALPARGWSNWPSSPTSARKSIASKHLSPSKQTVTAAPMTDRRKIGRDNACLSPVCKP
jgi:hypothetical protein